MAIKYYPNRIYKGVYSSIDRVMAQRKLIKVEGRNDISTTAIDYTLSENSDWIVDSVSLKFSNATPRDYSVAVKNGRRVVSNLNDFLFFATDQVLQQQITLDDGFYTGNSLAAHLQAKMNANSAFSVAGYGFAVSYSSTNGSFTVVPNKGAVKYIDNNPRNILSLQQSIAGHLFGFNANTALGGSIVSDTTVYGLETESAFISSTGATELTRYHDDMHNLSVDQAIHLYTGVAAVVVDYSIVYEKIV